MVEYISVYICRYGILVFYLWTTYGALCLIHWKLINDFPHTCSLNQGQHIMDDTPSLFTCLLPSCLLWTWCPDVWKLPLIRKKKWLVVITNLRQIFWYIQCIHVCIISSYYMYIDYIHAVAPVIIYTSPIYFTTSTLEVAKHW